MQTVELKSGRVVDVDPTPLLELGYFKVIRDVPLEPMHILWLLCSKYYMRYIISCLKHSKLLDVLDSRLKVMEQLSPSEFARRVSGTSFLSTDWKATCYRQFFLYLAYPLLEDLLDEEQMKLLAHYQYFLYIVCGMSNSPIPDDELDFADAILDYFLPEIMLATNGDASVPAFHFLRHCTEDCRHHRCHLEQLSAFKYESAAMRIKACLHSGNWKLEQLRNRLIEQCKYMLNRDADDLILRNDNGEVSMGWNANEAFEVKDKTVSFRGGKYKTVTVPGIGQISTAWRDSFVLLSRSDRSDRVSRLPRIFRVLDIAESTTTGELNLIGHVSSKIDPLFSAPRDSRTKHVYSYSQPILQMTAYPLSNLVGKLFPIPRFSKFASKKKVTIEDLGANLENVTEWVGILEQHMLANVDDDEGTLY